MYTYVDKCTCMRHRTRQGGVALTLPVRRIDRDLHVPFYYQVVQILRDFIQDLSVSPGDEPVILPSENELTEFFQVNRGTIRHALELLEGEGLLYREKGRGTFARRRRVELDLSTLSSTTEDLRARGWAPSSRPVRLELLEPTEHIAQGLKLGEDEHVWLIQRVRLANGEPISVQWSYVPERLAADLGDRGLPTSLYYLLQNAYGITLRSGEQTIRTRASTPEEAKLLEVKVGTPVFEIDRITFDENQTPVEHLHSLWRGDRYDLRVHLYAPNRIASP